MLHSPAVLDPITRTCRTNFPAYHHSGERGLGSIRYVVLHSTDPPFDGAHPPIEQPTAAATAHYFEDPQSGGSAHLVVDDMSCYRCLADTVIPWGAPPLNTHGFHIEQGGYSRWTRSQWLTHRLTIQRAAYKAALRIKARSIPVRVLTVDALIKDFGQRIEGGVPTQPGPMHGGIVTHAVVAKAYGLGDGHTDPGAGYPIDVFIDYVSSYLTGRDL